jgi:hypothetical protein
MRIDPPAVPGKNIEPARTPLARDPLELMAPLARRRAAQLRLAFGGAKRYDPTCASEGSFRGHFRLLGATARGS